MLEWDFEFFDWNFHQINNFRLFTGTPFQEEAENLCLQDLRRQSTESSAAQALLSLGRTDREMFIPYGQNNILREKPQEFFLSCNKLQHMPNGFPSIPILHTPLREIQSYLNSEADHRPKSVMTKPLSGLENQVPSNKKPSSKAYHCSECKKGFSTQSGFIKHDELHKSNQIQRDFSCRFCNKFYTTLSALKMHVRTHTLPCKCNICGKSFSRPWLLQGHVRTHTGEKPFSCNFCLRSFADKSNLRAHLQTHLQTKKYSCQKCQKTFSRMSLLNKHTESNCKSGQISVLLRS